MKNVSKFITHMMPCIEIVGYRQKKQGIKFLGDLSSDFGANIKFLIGQKKKFKKLNIGNLKCNLKNIKTGNVVNGNTNSVYINPLNSLRFVLNKMKKDKIKLNSNFFVFTGSTVGVVPLKNKGNYIANIDKIGTVKSTIAISQLLNEVIGDTIRVSLAADPIDEIKVGFDILKSLKLRKKGINFIACPSCSRQNFDVIGTMNELEKRLEDVKESIDVAIIGCYVNGPGESKAAHVGLTGANPKSLIYVDGLPDGKISNEEIVDQIEQKVRFKVKEMALSKEKLIASS